MRLKSKTVLGCLLLLLSSAPIVCAQSKPRVTDIDRVRLAEAFRRAGYGEISPSYGSILLPLFEEDGLRIGELARRANLSKQAMTTMVKVMERKGLIARRRDPADARASRIFLTPRTRRFQTAAERVLAEMARRVETRLSPAEIAQLSQHLNILMNL